MTQRYSDNGANILFQHPQGPFVHFLDYEILLNGIREALKDYTCRYSRYALQQALREVVEDNDPDV